MSFTSWLRNLRSCITPVRAEREHRRRAPRAVTYRPRLEVLGDRCLPSFLVPVSYAAGSSPGSVATGDFNNDTVLDLAVANYSGSGTVSVLLGNADGTFRPPVTSATGAYRSSLAVGDFNADGKLDIATDDSYAVSVLLGNGDGTFQAAPTITPLGSNPRSLAVGDFNADGKLDLGVLSTYGGDTYTNAAYSAGVLLGNGDGSFSAQSATGLVGGSSIAVADFNGDGNLDFATTNSDYGSVGVLLGDGFGNLLPPSDFFAGFSRPDSVAAGDVNGDGNIDLVTTDGDSNNLSVLPGDGRGSFGVAQLHGTGGYPGSVVLGDFNRDGHVDLMLVTMPAPNTSRNVSVLFGIGGGAFSEPRNFAAGVNPGTVVAGDFNGDGWLDAAATDHYPGGVSVLINDTHWPPADAPSVSVNDVSVTEGNAGTVSAIFTVSLSAAYGQPVTVHFTTADGTASAGSDYAAGSGDVTFAPGEISKSIVVAVLGDRSAEPAETFVVSLSAPVNATINDGMGAGTILDDEPRVGISDVTVAEGNVGTANATFTVRLSVAYDVPVTVGYATTGGTATAGGDYQAASGTLTIPAGQTSGTITVPVTGDRVVEPNETFFVNLSSPTYGVIADGTGIGTIVDDEPRISVNSVSVKEGNSGMKVMTFTVTLSAAYDQAVTVNYATHDGTATVADGDYVAISGTLTFAPGQTTRTFTVVIKGDKKKEADESFYVLLSGASTNALIDNAYGWGTILDDDHAGGSGH